MKLQQLRYIWEVAQNELNVSAAADSLFTSQPGMSKQIRQLESELGIEIFTRHGKHFTGMTPGGTQIVEVAGRILAQVGDIRQIASESLDKEKGELSIATTHTQARYALPDVISQFMQRHPGVQLQISQGTPAQIAELVSRGEVDLGIATEATDLFENLVVLPCYQWNRSVLAPQGHPLAGGAKLTLDEVARYPIITYTFGFTGRSQLDQAFHKAGLQPRLVLTAVDADVIKTYVRLGLGIGIVAHMAYDPVADTDLIALDASELFNPSVTKVVLRRNMYLREYVYDFIHMFAPHLGHDLIDQGMKVRERQDWEALFGAIKLPYH